MSFCSIFLFNVCSSWCVCVCVCDSMSISYRTMQTSNAILYGRTAVFFRRFSLDKFIACECVVCCVGTQNRHQIFRFISRLFSLLLFVCCWQIDKNCCNYSLPTSKRTKKKREENAQHNIPTNKNKLSFIFVISFLLLHFGGGGGAG